MRTYVITIEGEPTELVKVRDVDALVADLELTEPPEAALEALETAPALRDCWAGGFRRGVGDVVHALVRELP